MNREKTDSTTGKKVHDYLVSIGLETPTTIALANPNEDKIKLITERMKEIHQIIGLDLTDDSLIDTPSRIAKMWVNEKFWGLHPENFPKMTAIENKMGYDEVLIENNIRVLSECEHHWQIITGTCSVAYKPKNKVLGLSKLNRIVQYFSARPQVQERLTQQIGETVKFITETEDVAVVMNAAHYCVISRGARDQDASTVTSYLSGVFRSDMAARAELMTLIKG